MTMPPAGAQLNEKPLVPPQQPAIFRFPSCADDPLSRRAKLDTVYLVGCAP